jgi:DNA-directed RNA polymerase subunit M/transcription elongation factor TFIIS
MKCNKCDTIMKPSKALKDIYISGIDSSNPPQNVAKCPKCGYSVTT